MSALEDSSRSLSDRLRRANLLRLRLKRLLRLNLVPNPRSTKSCLISTRSQSLLSLLPASALLIRSRRRYSDSGDEGHDEKVKALPHWAQSPALAAALYRQQHVNPDDIFGPIPPLSMQGRFSSLLLCQAALTSPFSSSTQQRSSKPTLLAFPSVPVRLAGRAPTRSRPTILRATTRPWDILALQPASSSYSCLF